MKCQFHMCSEMLENFFNMIFSFLGIICFKMKVISNRSVKRSLQASPVYNLSVAFIYDSILVQHFEGKMNLTP